MMTEMNCVVVLASLADISMSFSDDSDTLNNMPSLDSKFRMKEVLHMCGIQ
jgi:hypothetical protein